MPGVQQLISMIVQLRQLQLAQASQDLQRKQLGLSGQSIFREMLGGLQDPNSMLSYIPEISQETQLSPELLKTMIQQTPPSVGATVAGAVGRGAKKTGTSLDTAAASRAMTGALPGGVQEDELMRNIIGGADQYLSELPEARRKPLMAGFLSRLTTGQDVGGAALSQATADFIQNAPQPVKDRIVAIGKGLAPSASEDRQMELGWANYRAQQRASEMGLALENLRIKASMEQAGKTLDAQAFKELNDLIQHRSELLTNMVKNSATMTPEGRDTFVDQINAFNQQIRSMAPQYYGKGAPYDLEDMKKGQTAGATGLFPFIKSWITQ